MDLSVFSGIAQGMVNQLLGYFMTFLPYVLLIAAFVMGVKLLFGFIENVVARFKGGV